MGGIGLLKDGEEGFGGDGGGGCGEVVGMREGRKDNSCVEIDDLGMALVPGLAEQIGGKGKDLGHYLLQSGSIFQKLVSSSHSS